MLAGAEATKFSGMLTLGDVERLITTRRGVSSKQTLWIARRSEMCKRKNKDTNENKGGGLDGEQLHDGVSY